MFCEFQVDSKAIQLYVCTLVSILFHILFPHR